ncbi:MAG: hypothetical protein E6I24_12735 [Chloroflexi bacterium]|nr:MAG: hypothetical protein E6I24_12735 [Chloroflexota bacterium]
MDHHKQPKPPRQLAGYLESMTRVVFSSGLNWRVVEAKWPAIREAFLDFEPERVARMSASDIDRLAGDSRVIRNVPKIEATVLNAKEVVAIGKTPDRFRFRYLGDHGTYYFLWSVGEKVPPWDEWSSRPSKPPARTTANPRKSSAKRARA